MSGPNGEPHVPVGGAGEDDDDDGDSFGEEAQSSAPARHRVRHAWLRRSPSCSEEPGGEEPAPAEYAAINSMLDQISSCLDHLEEKNDYLHACLKELLESNRQTRLEFQQQSEQQGTEADVQGSQPPG